jgi:DNA-directed RNA polymerase subunit N (RpoN/RPB10)
VYSVKVDSYGHRSFYACLYRTGRRRPVGDNPHDVYNEIRGVKIASPYVAYVARWTSSQTVDDFLVRLDVRTGRDRQLDQIAVWRYCCSVLEQLRRFLVTPFGAVVWARYREDNPRPMGEIRKIDHAGVGTLDRGREIPAHTLRLNRTGHRVYWENAGKQRKARLR